MTKTSLLSTACRPPQKRNKNVLKVSGVYIQYIRIISYSFVFSYKWKHVTLHFYPKKFKRNIEYNEPRLPHQKLPFLRKAGTSSRSRLWSFHPQCLQRMVVSISREWLMVGSWSRVGKFPRGSWSQFLLGMCMHIKDFAGVNSLKYLFFWGSYWKAS